MNDSILVIEDDKRFNQYLLSLLVKENYRVHQVYNLEDALNALKEFEYKAIILDLGLPDSEGTKTLNELRNHARIVPVIVLTGNSEKGEILIQLGAQDFISKNDVTKGILLRSLRYSIARKEAEIIQNQKTLEIADRIMTLWKSTSKEISDLHQFVAEYKGR